MLCITAADHVASSAHTAAQRRTVRRDVTYSGGHLRDHIRSDRGHGPAHRLSAALSVTDTAPRRASSTNRDHVADTLTNVAVTIASQRPESADRLAGDVSYASIVLCRLRKTSSFRRHYGEKPKI